MKNKKYFGWKITSVIVIAATLGIAVQWKWNTSDRAVSADQAYKTETVRRGNVTSGISESGTIEYGTKEQTFCVAEITEVSAADSSESSSGSSSMQGGFAQENASQKTDANQNAMASSSSSENETSLIVEEVYAASGQEVSKEDKILKITDSSIEEYRKQLEAAVETAQLNVKQEEINVESKKSEAEYTYQMYLAEGEIAEETYQATITTLENTVADLESELEEAQEEVDTYQTYVDSGYDYADELEEAQENYSTIKANLQIAKNNRTTKSLEAKQTYENAMTNYKYADQLYEIDTNGLEDDLNEAKETLETAQNALSDFEEQIGDGIVYASYAGTVMEVAYAAGDCIANDAAIVTYIDPDQATMSVSVSQDDISQVAVGEVVCVYLNAYEDEEFTGTVSNIATSASAGSSTVNYEVSVLLEGDVSKIYSGMNGEAVFAGKNIADTLYISNKAVNLDGATSWVKVLEEDGTIRKAEITTSYSNGTIVAVESGLEEGETVLIESQVED